MPLPIGALTGALAADLAYAATATPSSRRAGRLLTLTGLVTGAVAAMLGGIDFWSKGQIRSHRIAWFHVIGNAAMLALSGISLGLRVRRGGSATVPAGLALSAASAIVLAGDGLARRRAVVPEPRRHDAARGPPRRERRRRSAAAPDG